VNVSTLAILGISSAILNIIGVVPYIRSILRGKTKPERSAWWIWTWLMIIAFGAQAAAGATWSLLLTFSYLVCNVVIAILSLRHGYGKFKLYDFLAIFFAVLGVAVWKVTNRPILALLIVIAIDFTGNILTMEKSWRAPYTENLITWMLGGLSAVLGLLAVGSWDAAKAMFPIYAVIVNLMMVELLNYRRRWRSQRIKSGLNARLIK
jgi:uncharacterized membrane protein YhdT